MYLVRFQSELASPWSLCCAWPPKAWLGFLDKGNEAVVSARWSKPRKDCADGISPGILTSCLLFSQQNQLWKLLLPSHTLASLVLPARVGDQARTFGQNGVCKTEPYCSLWSKGPAGFDCEHSGSQWQILSCREVSGKHQGNTMWDMASWVRRHSKYPLLLLVWNYHRICVHSVSAFGWTRGNFLSLLHSDSRSHSGDGGEGSTPFYSSAALEWWPQKWSHQARDSGLRWGPPSFWFYFSSFTVSLTNTSKKHLKN